MRRTLAVAVVVIASGCAADEQPAVVPWLDLRPPAVDEPNLAPACRAHALRATLALQGATGNLIGAVRLRNVGRRPCSLQGRPRFRFEGEVARRTRWTTSYVRADAVDSSLFHDRGSSLRALRPGRVAAVPVLWSQWCPPGVRVTSRGMPPTFLAMALPHHGGVLRMRTREAPRCDDLRAVSCLASKPFLRVGSQRAPRTRLPLRAEIVGTARGAKPGLVAVRARRGQTLRFTVKLTNWSSRAFRFDHCPVYTVSLSSLWPRMRYVLNCRGVAFDPGSTVAFAVVVRVPRDLDPGAARISWVLGESTYLAPSAHAQLLLRG